MSDRACRVFSLVDSRVESLVASLLELLFKLPSQLDLLFELLLELYLLLYSAFNNSKKKTKIHVNFYFNEKTKILLNQLQTHCELHTGSHYYTHCSVNYRLLAYSL